MTLPAKLAALTSGDQVLVAPAAVNGIPDPIHLGLALPDGCTAQTVARPVQGSVCSTAHALALLGAAGTLDPLLPVDTAVV